MPAQARYSRMTVLNGKTLTGKSQRSRTGAKLLERKVLRQERKGLFELNGEHIFVFHLVNVT